VAKFENIVSTKNGQKASGSRSEMAKIKNYLKSCRQGQKSFVRKVGAEV